LSLQKELKDHKKPANVVCWFVYLLEWAEESEETISIRPLEGCIMAKHHSSDSLPACYAMVVPGLEKIAAEEITRDLKGEVKKTAPGLVVFRVGEIDQDLLRLRTVEDVFLLGWGTDQLTYRAEDLESFRKWTDRDVNWQKLLQIHHTIRPKPKGRPTYRLVAQMQGPHGYRRVDALKAMAGGLQGKWPASWRPAEENAALEVWLTIHGATAFCGIRLSDRTMRHRDYKREHIAASLRPTVAAAMVHLAQIKPRQVILDPMCGAGTILAELLEYARNLYGGVTAWGGDADSAALRAAAANLRRLGLSELVRWDAGRLPLPDQTFDCIISNPPFGKQLSSPDEIGRLYRRALHEYNRVLRANGLAVLIVSELSPLKDAVRCVGWQFMRKIRVRVLGQSAVISVLKKLES
jgi:23S rRNA G2445 N2-methylase RlmL